MGIRSFKGEYLKCKSINSKMPLYYGTAGVNETTNEILVSPVRPVLKMQSKELYLPFRYKGYNIRVVNDFTELKNNNDTIHLL